ncbi:MAG: TIGR02302 family protein [Alphaproteobacteria bacterium]|nr:TIGR02302 family protein [Alphaproteobacteria bacterium]
MPISSPRTAFPTGFPANPLERRVALARGVLAIERLLPLLWPAVGFLGFYLALALTGVFALIPWPVQALLLAATVTTSALSLYDGFEDFAWPRTIDAARRLERDSGLAHRPISERDDVLVGDDPVARALWDLHRARTLPEKFRIGLPRTGIAERDPQGLRWYLLIAVAVGLVLARSDTGTRLVSAFDSGAGAAASLDAWIDPPPYTGLPLTSLHIGDTSVIRVPQGSVLNLRVHGAPRTPGLAAGNNAAPRFAGEDGEYSSNVILSTNARVRVQVGGHAIGKWNIQAVPDAAPTIAFTAKPSPTEQKATQFAFKGSDDYGISSARAVLAPLKTSGGGHGKPLVVELPLPESGAKTVDQNSYVDLTSNPYAGLTVTGHLEARDAIGQKGISAPVTFKLPARVFTDPLARALIEQRQQLATSDAAGRKIVLLTLDALTIAPDKFYAGKNDIFLALRSAFNGVKNAKTEADIARVENILWETALKLERGGLLSAAEELRKLQMMITAALASGAPQDVIDELLKRYNEAMQKYMAALAANPPAPGEQQPLPPDAKTIGQNDIQTMLDMIKKLTQAGDRQKAAQLLAMLQSMLENMRMTQGQGGSGGPQNKALNETLQKYGNLMGKQRALLDKTFRQQQGQADPKDGGPQGLQKQQSDLEKELEDSLKGMDGKSAQKLREAGKAMGEAQSALGKKDLTNAGSSQNQALDALRQGAQALADEQGQGQKQGGGQDPLGRGNAPLDNSGVKIPGAADLARARQILEELRRRAGQMNRPQQERDYLDRLLKAF